MGGVLVALQAVASHRRAKALEETAQNTEQGQRQERLKNAIEHLGDPSDSVRLGGAYELFHLAQDTEELRQTVLDILCAHIRRTTGESTYQKTHESTPSEEIQSLLTLLFVQDHDAFKGLRINLQGSWLRGATLSAARLQGAMLEQAQLQGAQLDRAQLQGANLTEARLQGAMLGQAQLQGARLVTVSLQEAFLDQACLRGASLFNVSLQGAGLRETDLQGARLSMVGLQGAHLTWTRLEGVSNTSQFDLFEKCIEDSIDQERDLSGVTFEGGLERKDLDVLVKDLAPEKATMLRRKLERHINKPTSHEPPENSDFFARAYTVYAAEKWIAEYKKAMSEVPGVDGS